MATFTSISIIYNPNSTGDSQAKAEELAANLKTLKLPTPVALIATEHAGHAEELAHELSTASSRPLIVSSSGDGGYHEVINGVLTAERVHHATTGLLPAGNANDHWHHMHRGDLALQILQGNERSIDVLKLTAVSPDGKTMIRYAHSYIGLGLSPQVGNKLNQVKLNRLNEAWIMLQTLFDVKPESIKVKGRLRRYDSIIASNIGKMAKVIKLSDEAALTDGKFELSVLPHRSRAQFLWTFIRAMVRGIDTTSQTNKFRFETVAPLALQLDGEIRTLAPGTKVEIGILPRGLRCVM